MRIIIFVVSLAMAGIMLVLERSVGIDWDYHPDSVTYATTSLAVYDVILTRGWAQSLNNAYFIWVALLDMSITRVTAANMVFFALGNVLLYRWHHKYGAPFLRHRIVSAIAVLLLIANPYRLHLATTMLKDSMIILLTIFIAVSPWKRAAFAVPLLLLVRIAGVFYLPVKLGRKSLLWLLAGAVTLAAIFSDQLVATLLDFNNSDMKLRDFDQIPNFQDYGLLGALLRVLTWPVLAISGVFVVLSPTAEYIPLAVASMMTIAYCLIVPRKAPFSLAVIVPMAILAALVTGFTAYIRYVYPLLVVLPVLVTRDAFLAHVERRSRADQAPPFQGPLPVTP